VCLTVTRIAGLVAVVWVSWYACASAQAQAQMLTFEQAMARAREQAPRVLVARARVDEARGRLAGASVRLPANPVIETSTGPRSLPGDRKTDFDVGISQSFELGNRRAARIAAAEAGIARETAQADAATRAVVHEAAEAFLRTAFARISSRCSRTPSASPRISRGWRSDATPPATSPSST
jgi:outer membrane protein TolC